jgi:hypothetical protein
MVLDATSCAYKNINSSTKFVCLAVNINTSINCKHVVFVGTVLA